MEVKQQIGRGSECTVYDIGDGKCYKDYNDEEAAEDAYRAAETAADNGIGPEVYERYDCGYVTEIVEVIKNTFCKKCKKANLCCEVCNEFIEHIGKDNFNEFEETVIITFGEYATADLHPGNIGIKDDKLLMIDFGYYSFS
jgi:hypothetical protein